MSYETIKEGFHHIVKPTASEGFLINVLVLGAAVILEDLDLSYLKQCERSFMMLEKKQRVQAFF